MEYVTLLSADCLQRSEGLDDQRFPKAYPVKISKGFLAYVAALAIFVLYSTLIHPVIFFGGLHPQLLALDVVYFAAIFGYIFFSMPTAVVREVDAIVIHFRFRKRVIPLKDIREIRIVHAMDFKAQTLGCKVCKIVWGFPTRLDKTVFVMTHSCCNNYQLGLADMEDFLKDNRPKKDEKTAVVGAHPAIEVLSGEQPSQEVLEAANVDRREEVVDKSSNAV
eukprot:TRINITY_DN20701_c0_g1_i1.p1 TRINITY_DN20701_c0_g1~~TRINITY_DN20701_c0_g1_i1.p1  ORF type:complete len:221 (+),score=35.42 TRINITY_DN20701_c0_g1_i1:93-755(+)